MSASHAHTGQDDSDWLAGVFTVAATGTAAGVLGVLSAPVTLGLGAVAAIAGLGMMGRSLASNDGDDNKGGVGNIALVAAITAAVTSFVVGLPLEFLSEAVVFPWAHDTAFGSQVMEATGEVLVPIYDTIGSWFGIDPAGTPLADIPIADI